MALLTGTTGRHAMARAVEAALCIERLLINIYITRIA